MKPKNIKMIPHLLLENMPNRNYTFIKFNRNLTSKRNSKMLDDRVNETDPMNINNPSEFLYNRLNSAIENEKETTENPIIVEAI